MIAQAIIPGRLYRVRGAGLDVSVIAGHGCDAICHVLSEVLSCAN
jgi:hypothetical protein